MNWDEAYERLRSAEIAVDRLRILARKTAHENSLQDINSLVITINASLADLSSLVQAAMLEAHKQHHSSD